MFNLGHRGQLTIYVQEDVSKMLLEFADAYPIASASDILNAALRYYLPEALKGCDGRLNPHKRDASKTVEEILEEFQKQRRVVWTPEQREARREADKRKGGTAPQN